MVNGNTTLSDTALRAFQRIKTLRTITAKTGIITVNQQYATIIELADQDALAVAEMLFQDKKAGAQ
jgi:hypothetical protein